jgi:exonuclease III
MRAVRIAFLNVNGVTSVTKIGVLTEFLYRQDIKIIFLQEVRHTETAQIRGYETYLNIGTMMRGTAVLTRNTTRLHQVQIIPSGRAIAATFRDLRLINIYAPFGTANRAEREYLYNSEMPFLMRQNLGSLILGGDFNCTKTPAETNGSSNLSRAVTELIRGMDLKNTWIQNTNNPTCTHYSKSDGSRIDRIYVSRALLPRKVGRVILPAAFTDHHAVVLSIETGQITTWRNRKKWKMNPMMISEESFKTALSNKWKEWKQAKKHCRILESTLILDLRSVYYKPFR